VQLCNERLAATLITIELNKIDFLIKEQQSDICINLSTGSESHACADSQPSCSGNSVIEIDSSSSSDGPDF